MDVFWCGSTRVPMPHETWEGESEGPARAGEGAHAALEELYIYI